jgi:hypothetical protein
VNNISRAIKRVLNQLECLRRLSLLDVERANDAFVREDLTER